MMKMKPAIPVYAVLSTMKTDYEGGFKKLSEIGYQYIELLGANPFAGKHLTELYEGWEMKRLLKSCGLEPISFHEQVPDLKTKTWDKLLSFCDTIRCERIVLPNIWIRTREEALRLAGELDTTGRFMKARGFTYVLHTHHLEFRRLDDGKTLVDIILENTDPKNLEIEFDMIWAIRGGVDPLKELEKIGARCHMIHQKDYRKDFPGTVNFFEIMKKEGLEGSGDLLGFVQKYSRSQEFFCTIGEGAFDVEGALRKIASQGFVEYVIAENEEKGGQQFDVARKEYNYLMKCMKQ